MLECTLCNRSVQTFKQDKMTSPKNIAVLKPKYKRCLNCSEPFKPKGLFNIYCKKQCWQEHRKERESRKYIEAIETDRDAAHLSGLLQNSSLESLYKLAGIEKKTRLIIYNEFPLIYIPKF